MNNILETRSLLPYLKADETRFHLKISVVDQNDSIYQKSSYPFLVISESGQFARIIEATIQTDAEANIEPVFLLIQKDEPALSRDALWPLDNRTIDQYWQNTFRFHFRKQSGSSPLILKNQMNKNGTLLPFHPCLYCKVNQSYFPPLCPDCGAVLQQCYNDSMLEECGLRPYSTSLKRYLFCPSCTGLKEHPDFYVSSLADDDPAFLKDRFELIKELGSLYQNKNLAGRLPCVNCSKHQECYGKDGLWVSRIVALSFYPFYMLMFKGDLVNGLDFLSLMSGASFKELEDRFRGTQEAGRLNGLKILQQKSSVQTPFFYKNEDKYFLEVLYLKLSFLGEVAQILFSQLDTLKCPEFGLSPDRIWVKLSHQNRLLPSFWNFKLALLDVIGANGPSSSIPQFPRSYGFHLLGLVWFHTLLVNGKQGVAQVYPALGEVMEKIGARDNADVENYLKAGFPQALSPENIFYSPDIRSVKQDWHKFWKISLNLGFRFFEVSMLGSSDWSMAEFEHELENLRQQIKDELFSTKPIGPAEEPEADDKIIYNILKNIMNTRRVGEKEDTTSWDEPETGHVMPQPEHTAEDKTATDIQEDTDVFKTVVLSSDDEFAEKLTGIEQKEAPSEAVPAPESDVDETVIIPPERPEPPGTPDDLDHFDEDMEETVILSSNEIEQHFKSSSKLEQDEFPETIIVAPEQGSAGYAEETPRPFVQDVGSETTEKGGVVPDNLMIGENKKAETSEPDELLEETLLIQPEKTYAKKKGDNDEHHE